ncbi:hypothetical protein Cgig2_006950 [Carnegiea gigantea]|uniref:Growth-regulating factor n=1 Tax=Carnegiea gigantea TaxID=171969 RepID=A0A9Q1QGX8_9CARY|nr:hypothetical protein Cgig2_006950 [Carnegiea gigantea]
MHCELIHVLMPVGWGYFQLGYGRNIDPEPGRCRRTDGKKWRCSKEACPNSKYCEKHINRGKSKSKKKQMQSLNPTTNTSPTSATNTIPLISCSVSPSYTTTSSTHIYPPELTDQGQDQGTAFYPFISPRSSSQQSSCSTMSDQNQHDLVWFMDPESHHDQPNKTIRNKFNSNCLAK